MDKTGLNHICKEIDGVMDWYYNSVEQRYYKFDNKGNIRASIGGEHMPDPYALEFERSQFAATLEDEQKNNYRIRCTPVTHLLWKHWKGVANG